MFPKRKECQGLRASQQRNKMWTWGEACEPLLLEGQALTARAGRMRWSARQMAEGDVVN